MSPLPASVRQNTLLDAARRGDERAFRELVAPLRGPLYGHCYRILRSSHDAEDAVQEAMLRAWRSLPSFEGRAPFRAWIYRIATNACLTALDRRPRQAVPLDEEAWTGEHDLDDHQPAEPNSTEAGYEEREGAALAVSLTLRHLPANQRAALILRDVLGLPAGEAASTLGTSVASVNSALQRARVKIDGCVERVEGSDSPVPAGAEHLRDAAEGFVGALVRGDVDTVIGIAADASLSDERAWAYSPVPAY